MTNEVLHIIQDLVDKCGDPFESSPDCLIALLVEIGAAVDEKQALDLLIDYTLHYEDECPPWSTGVFE